MSSGGFFSGERFKKDKIDHQFGGHFRIFYCVSGHLNGHFLVFFKCSPLKNPPLVSNGVDKVLNEIMVISDMYILDGKF